MADHRSIVRTALRAVADHLQPVPRSRRIAFVGNSLVQGHMVPADASLPAQVAALIGRRWRVANLGVGGQVTAELPDDVGWRGVCVIWEGTNELAAGATADDAFGRLRDYCYRQRIARRRVLLLTILPRQQPGLPEGFDAARVKVNDRLRGSYSWHQLIDVAAIPSLSDPTDARFYHDGIHLTPAGYALVAEPVAQEIREPIFYLT